MDVQNLIADIQLNPSHYIGKTVCVYMAQVALSPITLPKATRSAVIHQWNKEYDNIYSHDKSALWVEDVKLGVVEENHPALINRKAGSLPVDVLMNHFSKVEIDLSDKSWEQNLNNAVADAQVKAHCCKAQIQELMQKTVNALIGVKLVTPPGTLAIKGLGQTLMAYRKCMRMAKDAKKAIAPLVYSTSYVGFAGECNTGCDVLNARMTSLASKAALRQVLQLNHAPLN